MQHTVLHRATRHPALRGGSNFPRANLSAASKRRGPARPIVPNAEVGDKVPDVQLGYFSGDGSLQDESVHKIFEGKKVVLVGVPGAFLPTCSLKHLPEYINAAEEMWDRGVDLVACCSANDAFVMDAWSKSLGADGKVLMLADGDAKFAKAMGVELDLSERNIGIRSQRYSAILEDLEIKVLNCEEGAAFTVSGADNIMTAL